MQTLHTRKRTKSFSPDILSVLQAKSDVYCLVEGASNDIYLSAQEDRFCEIAGDLYTTDKELAQSYSGKVLLCTDEGELVIHWKSTKKPRNARAFYDFNFPITNSFFQIFPEIISKLSWWHSM